MKYTLFLIDDDLVFLETIKLALVDDERFSVTAFQTGEECIANMHLKPDIVVLDHHLDSVNKDAKSGLEVLKEIINFNPRTKVIILSAQEDGNLVYRFAREDAADYVVKDEEAVDALQESLEKVIEEIKDGYFETDDDTDDY